MNGSFVSGNLRLARSSDPAELRFDRRFDLIVCSDVLHYLRAPELVRGLSGFAELLDGLAFIELFSSRDPVEADMAGFIPRPPGWCRKRFADARLMACDSHCHLKTHSAASSHRWPHRFTMVPRLKSPKGRRRQCHSTQQSICIPTTGRAGH